ncbi:UDP-N-acetyl-D-mannosamine dehydrogenase, partial [Herbaspirillum sp. HC18]
IACYGLAFKPDIDDLRESPALNITKSIASMHAGQVLAVEPNIERMNFEQLKLVNIDESLTTADIHLLLVDHKQFKDISPSNGVIIDTKGIWRFL